MDNDYNVHCGPQLTDLYDPREQWASYLINALKAKELQAKDVNYIVRGQEVIIVDEFTGRTMPGRRWGDGLHQVRHVQMSDSLPRSRAPERGSAGKVTVGACTSWQASKCTGLQVTI